MKRPEVERVQFGSPCPFHPHQPRPLQHVEMLRHRLPGQDRLAFRYGAGAKLEERLPRPLAQAIDDPAPRRVGQSFEDIVELIGIHGTATGKRFIAYLCNDFIACQAKGREIPALQCAPLTSWLQSQPLRLK